MLRAGQHMVRNARRCTPKPWVVCYTVATYEKVTPPRCSQHPCNACACTSGLKAACISQAPPACCVSCNRRLSRNTYIMLTGDNGPGLPLVNNPYERLVRSSCRWCLSRILCLLYAGALPIAITRHVAVHYAAPPAVRHG
jgi:hypothetical protein